MLTDKKKANFCAVNINEVYCLQLELSNFFLLFLKISGGSNMYELLYWKEFIFVITTFRSTFS